MGDWHYGRITSATALRMHDRVIVRVHGVKPAPSCDVKLCEYAPDPAASPDVRLGLYWKLHPRAGAVERTAYTASVDLDAGGTEIGLVRIDHADGYLDVRVRRIAVPHLFAVRAEPGLQDRDDSRTR